MAKSRDANNVTASTLVELVSQLNLLLPRFSDRLDKLEGIRDSFSSDSAGNFEGGLTAHAIEIQDTANGNEIIHSLGED
jgi:hypothetical protein